MGFELKIQILLLYIPIINYFWDTISSWLMCTASRQFINTMPYNLQYNPNASTSGCVLPAHVPTMPLLGMWQWPSLCYASIAPVLDLCQWSTFLSTNNPSSWHERMTHHSWCAPVVPHPYALPAHLLSLYQHFTTVQDPQIFCMPQQLMFFIWNKNSPM